VECNVCLEGKVLMSAKSQVDTIMKADTWRGRGEVEVEQGTETDEECIFDVTVVLF
jgi:hypothetical protein